MSNKTIIEIKDENGKVHQTLSGETAIVMALGGIKPEDKDGKSGLGFDGNIGIVGRKLPVENAGAIYGHIFARTIKALFNNELEAALVLSEVADICKDDSEKIMESMTPEKFAAVAADSLAQVFKEIFEK